MRNPKAAAKTTAALLLVGGTAGFFYHAFRANWSRISQFQLTFHALPLLASVALVLLGYLLFTLSWCVTLNRLSSGKSIGFREGIAVVNTSNLTKYLPGKVWSYALQMYWLEGIGFRKSLVLYVNLVNLFVALATTLTLGFACLIIVDPGHAGWSTYAILGVLLLANLVFIVHNAYFTGLGVRVVNRRFRKDIEHFRIAPLLAVAINAIQLTAALCSGMAAYLLCVGIGFDVAPEKLLSIMAAALISEVVGFLAVVVPGGLGVKESVMYVMLSADSSQTLALLLPLATRIIGMIVDALLGLAGYAMLRSLLRKTALRTTSAPGLKR